MQIAEHMTFDPVAMEYYPTLFFNDFWLLKDYLIPMNETVTEVPLSFTLSSMTLWKFTLFSQMDQAFGKQVWSLDGSQKELSTCCSDCCLPCYLHHFDGYFFVAVNLITSASFLSCQHDAGSPAKHQSMPQSWTCMMVTDLHHVQAALHPILSMLSAWQQ